MKRINCEDKTKNIIQKEKVVLNLKCICCGEETEKIIYVPCSNCGELHDQETMHKTDIEYLCAECLERDFTCCSECGVWVHNDDIYKVTINGGYEVHVCQQCRTRIYRGF